MFKRSVFFLFTASLLIIECLIGNLYAQSFIGSTTTGRSFKKAPPVIFANDTLVPPAWNMPCGDSVFIYSFSPPNTGYIFGNNSYGETECAQRYNFVNGNISGVLVWYGHKVGTSGSTTAKIYSINGTTKAPQNALGTSSAITTGSITTTNYTSYVFSTAVPVSNGLYAAVSFPTTTGDSVGILAFEFGCSSADSLSWLNIPSLGGWRSVAKLFSALAPTNNTDLLILPVGAINAGVNEYSSAGLSLLGAYPNPSKDETCIRYTIADNSKVHVKIFDLAGNTILESADQRNLGSHEVKLNLKNLSTGNYFYTVTTNKTSLTSSFSVVR